MTTIFKRKSLRLKNHDYSEPGYYFVTVCVQNQECLLGEIANAEMKLSKAGEIVFQKWNNLPKCYSNCELDTFQIMPNHFHGIIHLNESNLNVGAGSPRPIHDQGQGAVTAPLRLITLGKMIAYFKYQSTKQINQSRQATPISVWQRNYHERIVRNEAELHRIREYIQNNPKQWHLDPENPDKK